MAEEITLKYRICSRAPGYRDLTLKLVDPETGRWYELRLTPKDVQSIIYECADAARQIGGNPPIDWDLYPQTIFWPFVTPWMAGPKRAHRDEGRV